jgi:hypothetical protein
MVLVTASVQKSSAAKNTNNDQYQEEPSSWSPLPTNGSDKGLSLPPEVIATIEAYDKAHGPSPLTLCVRIPLRRGVLYATLYDKVC